MFTFLRYKYRLVFYKVGTQTFIRVDKKLLFFPWELGDLVILCQDLPVEYVSYTRKFFDQFYKTAEKNGTFVKTTFIDL